MNKDTTKSQVELDEENALLDEVVSNNINLKNESKKESESENGITTQVLESPMLSSDKNDHIDAQEKTEVIISTLADKCEENVQHVPNKNKMKISTEDDSITCPIMCKRFREDSFEFLSEEVLRERCNSTSSSSTSSGNDKRKIECETDPAILARRQKDIDYGKNTIGYDRYIQAIPKKDRTKEHPKTPPMYAKYSRRGWDGMVKLWRKQLHCWDPNVIDH